MLAANHKPVIRGTDLGIWRRIHLVPFDVVVPESGVDRGLPTALEAEAGGILNWMIEGYFAWRERELDAPKAVRAATEAYKVEMDPLTAFFDDCLVFEESKKLSANKLYATYKHWVEENGIKFPLAKPTLGREMKARGYEAKRGTDGERIYRGIGRQGHVLRAMREHEWS
jgi:putative DNA primase/helicase